MNFKSYNDRLVTSPQKMQLSEALQNQTALDINVTLEGLAALIHSPALMNKLRGAFGQVLVTSGSHAVMERKSCDWGEICPAEIFFGKKPMFEFLGFQSEISKPFILKASTIHHPLHGQSLRLTLRLFGFAKDYKEVARFAFLVAIRHFVDWKLIAKDVDFPLSRPIIITNCVYEEKPFLKMENNDKAITINFHTPLDNERADFLSNPQKLIERLVRRVVSLSYWYGADMREEASVLPLFHLSFEGDHALKGKGGHRYKNTLALLPSLRLEGNIHQTLPYLQAACLTHIGRGASLGLGEISLSS